jgi:hypothetical protein
MKWRAEPALRLLRRDHRLNAFDHPVGDRLQVGRMPVPLPLGKGLSGTALLMPTSSSVMIVVRVTVVDATPHLFMRATIGSDAFRYGNERDRKHAQDFVTVPDLAISDPEGAVSARVLVQL